MAAQTQSTVEQLLQDGTVERALTQLDTLESWITMRHVECCQIPAPPFEEQNRAEHVRRIFQQIELDKIKIDSAGNVRGEIPGSAPARERGVVALTAHLDTVFPRGTKAEIRSEGGRLLGPGITDNGAGLAAMLGVARALKLGGWRGRHTLLLVANTGEEGEGNLRGMRQLLGEAAVRDRLRGMVVIDGPGTEHITARGLGSRRYLITVEGPGGHSWTEFGTVNPIHAMAAAVTRLASFSWPSEPRATLSVGELRAGTSVNSIPASAAMKVDIRSSSEEVLKQISTLLQETVRQSVDEENRRSGRGALTFQMQEIGYRPSGELPAGARILDVIQQVDAHLGLRSRLEQSSTDANLALAMGLEAISVGGGGQGGGMHTLAEWYDPSNRVLGLKRILLAVALLAS